MTALTFIVVLVYKLVCIQCADLPNFIMIMADDMGWGDVSYNNGTALTPNIDVWRYSPHTIVFQRGYSGSPLCSPTRASVLTGRTGDRECIYSANQGAYVPAWEYSLTMPLPTSTFTIAEAVKKADNSYQTALFGKWHLGDFWDKGEGNPVSYPGNNGFDYWFATEGNAPTATPNCGCDAFSDTPNTCVLGHYAEANPNGFCKTYWYQNDSASIDVQNISYKVDRNYNNDTDNERDTYFIITKFEEWLQDTADLTKPMLVMLWIHAPHSEYIATDEFRRGCQNGMYCIPPPNGALNYTSKELDYNGLIADIDSQIGRLRQLLRTYNIYNNTLLWFNSDNGPQGEWDNPRSSTNGLRGRKDDVWEGGIRVPTIMEWPAVIPDGSFNTDYPVVTHDLLPTIMDILNIESDTPDWDLDGMSIMFVLESGGQINESRSSPIGFTYAGSGLSLAWMEDEWKVVDNSNHCEGDECDAALYNLNNDPFEQNDLSSIYPERFERMKEEMHDWYKRVIRSQIHDTKCIYDRAKTYWEYVIIGIVAGVVCCCCLICLICLALKCGWITLAAGCYCCSKAVDELQEEIEMNKNADHHEKNDHEKTDQNTTNADTSELV